MNEAYGEIMKDKESAARLVEWLGEGQRALFDLVSSVQDTCVKLQAENDELRASVDYKRAEELSGIVSQLTELNEHLKTEKEELLSQVSGMERTIAEYEERLRNAEKPGLFARVRKISCRKNCNETVDDTADDTDAVKESEDETGTEE